MTKLHWDLMYNIALMLYLPVATVRFWMRNRRSETPMSLASFLGLRKNRVESGNKPLVWVHAVSVGETNAVADIIRWLLEHKPTLDVLLTNTTPSGQQWARQQFGKSVSYEIYPYDTRHSVRAFLDRYQPSLGVLSEMEVWPNMAEECRKRSTPLVLINARMSRRSAKRYAKAYPLAARMISALSATGAQTQRDAKRIRFFGAKHVTVTGNLKFDRKPAADKIQAGLEFRKKSQRPIMLFASTRPGEEAEIIPKISNEALSRYLTLFVPRHPERREEIALLVDKRGVTRQFMSEKPHPCDNGVIIGDTMGEMAFYYAAADVVFIGGSLKPYGGQNLVEALALGKPVVIGPHTENFSDTVSKAVAAEAAIQVTSAGDAVAKMLALMDDNERCKQMGTAAKSVSETLGGACASTVKLIEPLALQVERQYAKE